MGQLKVLKENEEGYGVIITEGVGFISPEQNKNFLREVNEKTNNEPYIVYATLQKYGVENRNGRIYPKEILEREVDRYKRVIQRNAAFSELDHPESSIVSLKGGSPHRILELWWEDNALIGKLEVLVSKGYRELGIISCDGDLMAHYLSYGMTLGISSRGVGTLKKINGKNVVQDDFELVCWDVVSSPSTPGSYIYDNPQDFKKYDEDIKKYTPNTVTGKTQPPDINPLLSRLSNFLKK